MTRAQAEAHQVRHGFAISRAAQSVDKTFKTRMNSTEAQYALILESQLRRNEIKRYRFEAVKVRIGDGCFYVPDFFIERNAEKPLFIEIKGFLRDDARVKFIASKELHGWAEWQMWRKTKEGWVQIL